MESYYIKTDLPEFTDSMKKEVESLGMREKRSFPIDFLFVSGEAAYYRNKVDTRQSNWISLLHGKSVVTLTNKITLHSKYGDSNFLIDSDIITSGKDIPVLTGRTLKIVKPLKGFQGRGITLLKTTSELDDWIGSHPDYKEWLVQTYIQNPALKDGYKFHLRVLVVVKKESKKPIEAYVATHKFYVKAEEKYKKDDWLNPRIHDTHYKPGKTESFPQILPDDWTETETVKVDKKINSILKTLLENETDFKADWNAKNGFEVFGVDILFDKKKPYILEFNNKISLKGRVSYAAPIVNLILRNEIDPYFVQII